MIPTLNPDARFRQRINILRWVVPLSGTLFVIVFQVALSLWGRGAADDALRYGIEFVFYGIAGPLVTFWILTRVTGWIEEKGQAARRAQTNERRLASLTSVSADAILSLDQTGRIESWNRGAELVFGYNPAEIIGQPFSRLLRSGDLGSVEFEWLVATARREGIIRGYETTGRCADGSPVDIELTATRVDDEDDAPPGISVILRDITDRKRREEEIRQLNLGLNQQVAERTRELADKVGELAQANATLQQLDQTRSEFVSLVAHQLRAPLTNLQGAVERMQFDCGAMNPTCSRMLAILREQIARLERLARGVLSAARVEAGELSFHSEPVSVIPIVKQAVEQMRSRAHPRPIRMLPKPGLPLVIADRDLVIEVLVNLLDNADKYSPPSEEVVIDVSADQTAVTVAVRDGGPGIPDGERERIFEKFYRTDSSDSQAAYGYGLGLYVCQQLIEAQGGHIWAENAPAGGSIFSFTLPIWQESHHGTGRADH